MVKVGSHFAETAFGVAGIAACVKSAEEMGLSGSIACATTGTYLATKIVQKCLKPNQISNFPNQLLTISLSSISYWMFNGNLAKRCEFISEASFCSVLSYSKPVIVAALGVSLIYSIYKFRRNLVASWTVNDKDIKVYRSGNQLELHVLDRKTKKTQKGLLETNGDSIAKEIAYLRACDVVLETDGSFLFRRPFYQEAIRRFGRGEGDACTLIEGEKGIVWQFHTYIWGKVALKKVTKQIPLACILFDKRNFYGFKEIDETRGLVESFRERALTRKVSKEECLCLAENTQIEWHGPILPVYVKKGEIVYNPNPEEVAVREKIKSKLRINPESFVRISALLAQSKIHGSYVISPRDWQVTLICVSGSELSNKGNHAELIIEGIKDKNYFMKMAHLRLPKPEEEMEGKKEAVEIKIFTNKKLEYYSRTETWKAPYQKVIRMIESIEHDVKYPPKLNALGSDSLLAKAGEESCFTWARKKLTIIDFYLGKSYIGWLATITSNYTSYSGNKR